MPHAVLCVGGNTAGYDNIPGPGDGAWASPAGGRLRLNNDLALTSTRPGPRHGSDLRPGSRRASPPSAALRLLDGDGGACALEGRPRLVRALLVDLLEHRLGRAVDQVLRLLEAEAGQAAHLLDDLNLLLARGLEDDVELVLLLGLLGLGAPGAAGGRGGHRYRGGRFYVERLLELLHERGQLEQRHLLE